MKKYIFNALVAGIIGATSIIAEAALVPSDQVIATTAIDAERQSFHDALRELQDDNWSRADDLLDKVVNDAAFSALRSGERHNALFLAGATAFRAGDNKRAHALYVSSSSMLEATGLDWHGRLEAANAGNDYADIIFCLTTIAARWPKTLSNVQDQIILSAVREAVRLPPQDEVSFRLLDALFQAGWKLDNRIEPSQVWRDFALLLIERNQVDRASSVSARITSPGALIGMKADKRFDRLVKPNPERFDIDAAANREERNLRAYCEDHPRSLQAIVDLTYSLLSLNRYDDVLRITDGALAEFSAGKSKPPPYDDLGDIIWIMDSRARALMGLNRWDEAVEQLVRAGRRPEHGDMNVSQAINLAFAYVEIGRPKDALLAISELGDASPYGQMQVEAVRQAAALELGDADSAAAALSYLRAHRIDAMTTFQEALVRAKLLDEAADLLVSRLADRMMRTQALIDVQHYTDPAAPP